MNYLKKLNIDNNKYDLIAQKVFKFQINPKLNKKIILKYNKIDLLNILYIKIISKKILVITGDFAEDYEVMVPVQVLQIYNYQVDVVWPDKKAAQTIQTNVQDFKPEYKSLEKLMVIALNWINLLLK